MIPKDVALDSIIEIAEKVSTKLTLLQGGSRFTKNEFERLIVWRQITLTLCSEEYFNTS